MLPYAWPWLLFAVILALHLVLPGRWVNGYLKDERGAPLRYRLNGLPVFFVSVALWAAACKAGWLAWDAFYLARWEMAASACVAGLLFTLVIVLPVPAKPGASLLADLYLGRLDNPRTAGGRLDAKMALYLLGAVVLELNLLSYGAHHLLRFPDDPSPGVFLYLALFSFFLMEYLFFEEVHLYTYDFMAEKVGFKLGWGCLVFYPFFYAVGLWTRADEPNPHTHPLLLAGVAVMFLGGWSLARGANLQKFTFKRDPTRPFLGVKPVALEDGERKVLVSGWWGVSRHVNYLGELLMATALALALGAPLALGPWLYPLYYVALLVPRQRDDDRRCARRYGKLWEEYERRVPWRIIPYVY